MTQKRKTDGIVCALGVSVAFVILSEAVRWHLHGAAWYFFSSAARLLFGLGILLLMRERYGTRLTDVFSFRNWRQALVAGCGFFVYVAYFLLEFAAGFSAVCGLSAAPLFLALERMSIVPVLAMLLLSVFVLLRRRPEA